MVSDPAAVDLVELAGGPSRTLSYQVRDGLADTGAVLVRGFPVTDDSALLQLGNDLGFVSTRGNGNPPQPIYRVTTSQKDISPHRLGSRSHREFALHTDSCGYLRPHAYVVLACVIADPAGEGVSLLLDGEALAAGLPVQDQFALQQTGLPFYAAAGSSEPILHAPILDGCGGRWRLRYRCDSLVRGGTSAIGSVARAALTRFENAVTATSPRRLLLAAGDVLVIDNRRILHGREPFSAGSPRLLKRLKLHDQAEDEDGEGPPCLW